MSLVNRRLPQELLFASLILSLASVAEAKEPDPNAEVPLATSPEQIVGDWIDEGQTARFRFTEEGGKLVGRIVWLEEPNGPGGEPVKDAKNPDSELRDRPLLGIAVFYNLVEDDDELTQGVAYDYDGGAFYKCKAHLDGPNTLKLRGYAGVSFFGSTYTMKRVAK